MSAGDGLDTAAVGLTSLVVIEGVKLFRELAPDLRELRRNNGDASVTADLRTAEVMTAAIMLLAGFSVGYATNNTLPIWIAAATVGVLVGLSEWTNAGARRFEAS